MAEPSIHLLRILPSSALARQPENPKAVQTV
jgi:hypothetical protein